MFSGSIAVLLLAAFFSSGQSTTTVPATAATATTAVAQTPATTAVAPASASAVVAPTPALTAVAPAPASTAVASASASTAVAPAPSSASAAPTSASVTAAPTKPSCASINFIGKEAWNASLADSKSDLYKNVTEMVLKAMKDLYNDSKKYDDVEVSEVKFSEKGGLTFAEAKLCLVVKTNDGTFLEDMFIAKVKTGNLHADFPVKSDSAGFESTGVEFKDWKAKDGECEKCEGAAGQFVIEGTCVAKTSSCTGLKNTKMTKDCVTYCDSSAGALTVSFFILAIGIFLSSSFQ